MRIPYPGLLAVRSPDRGYQRHVRWRDRTLDLLLRGYPTLGELRRRGGKEAGVVVPLLGRPSLCVGGPVGVRLFYDETLTTRPHGGGDPAAGHRRPGEAATVALLEGAARRLAALRYRVVKRGPVDLARMPPHPGLLITDVQIP